MSKSYSHKQVAHSAQLAFVVAIVVIALAASALVVVEAGGSKANWPLAALAIGAAIIVLVVAVALSSITTKIGDGQLRWYFGPGFWRKSLLLNHIEATKPVRNRWWYGWGIRYTPHGWLYNVTGLDAVEILLKNSKKIRIGTDEPDVLQRALQRARI